MLVYRIKDASLSRLQTIPCLTRNLGKPLLRYRDYRYLSMVFIKVANEVLDPKNCSHFQ